MIIMFVAVVCLFMPPILFVLPVAVLVLAFIDYGKSLELSVWGIVGIVCCLDKVGTPLLIITATTTAIIFLAYKIRRLGLEKE
jgi:hypothetical protein